MGENFGAVRESESYITIVNFKKNEIYADAYGLWQYDYGQIMRIQGLSLPAAVEIHFSLAETGQEALRRVGTTKDGVTDVVIPDSMLENDVSYGDVYYIYAFVYLTSEDSGSTEYKIRLRVKTRPKPEAFERPEDADLFRDAISAVNDSATRAEDAQKAAEAARDQANNTVTGIEESVRELVNEATEAKNTAVENANISVNNASDTAAYKAEVEQDKADVAQMKAETEQIKQQTLEAEQRLYKAIPKKVSELENDKGYIDNTADNLLSYYLKSEVYTKDEVQSLIGRIASLQLLKVDVLPTENINSGIIYLVPKDDGTENNIYTEYIYMDGAWEVIGDTTVDLSQYALKTEMPTKLSQLTNDANYSKFSGSYNDLLDKPEIKVGVVYPTETTIEIQPNTMYIFGEAASLTITLAEPSDESHLNEYMFEFTSGSTATALTVPDTVKWASDLNIEANKIYQVSIVNNIGIIMGVSYEIV